MINFLKNLYLLVFNKNIKIENNLKSNNIYSEKKINKQKLYEEWCKKEKWLLQNEALLLLFSIDPSSSDTLDTNLLEKINSLKCHANDCVNKNLLPIINIDKPENEWEVRPIDLYQWATVSRINIPDEFNALMTFIVQSVKVVDDNSLNNNQKLKDEIHQLHKEIILGATTSLLINSPEKCKDNHGIFDIELIAEKIIQNEKQWFDNSKSKLSKPEMIKLINNYINMSKIMY